MLLAESGVLNDMDHEETQKTNWGKNLQMQMTNN